MDTSILNFLAKQATPEDHLISFNLYLTVGFVFLTLALFAFILALRWRDGFRFARRRKAEKEIQSFLTNYIFEDNTEPDSVQAFAKQFVTGGTKRQLVIENMVSLHKNLIGETADKLRLLYEELNLQHYSNSKLYSGSWQEVAKGIGELADMGIFRKSEQIRGFVNHPQPILRSVAQVALLKLKTDAPFSFLGELKEPLLDWQQLQLARAAYKSQYLSIPDFGRWLNHQEESVVVFCLRMISFYGQHNATEAILKLLQHHSSEVRAEAIVTLRNLESYDAVPMLTSMFALEATDIQLEILKTLPAIGDTQSLPFYEQILGTENRSLQLAAAKAMCLSGEEGRSKIQAIHNDSEHALQKLAATALRYRS